MSGNRETSTLAKIVIAETTDFQDEALGSIKLINFTNSGGSAVGIFGSSQFGRAFISPTVTVNGSVGENGIEVNLVGKTNFNASGWSFSNWNDDRVSIFGSDAFDHITGSVKDDLVRSGDGFDFVTAGRGDDRIDGGNGNDYLLGRNGTDTIFGGTGDDEVTGGKGGDKLDGGTGGDRFVYYAFSESTPDDPDIISGITSRDTVALGDIDFIPGGGQDHINVTGNTPFMNIVGQVIVYRTAKDTIIAGDADGDAKADFMIIVRGHTDFGIEG